MICCILAGSVIAMLYRGWFWILRRTPSDQSGFAEPARWTAPLADAADKAQRHGTRPTPAGQRVGSALMVAGLGWFAFAAVSAVGHQHGSAAQHAHGLLGLGALLHWGGPLLVAAGLLIAVSTRLGQTAVVSRVRVMEE